MARERQPIWLVVAVVIGAAAGVITTLVVTRSGQTHPTASASAQRQPTDQKKAFAVLERRIAALEAERGLGLVTHEDPEAADESRTSSIRDAQAQVDSASYAFDAESRTRLLAAHQARVNSVRAETRDALWASKTERLFVDGFGKIAASAGFKTMSFDCRTTRCLGVFEWGSSAAAHHGYLDVLHAYVGPNCTTSILIPDLDSKNLGPIQATAIFDCAEWKQDGTRIEN
jgi:hypothetical protein